VGNAGVWVAADVLLMLHEIDSSLLSNTHK